MICPCLCVCCHSQRMTTGLCFDQWRSGSVHKRVYHTDSQLSYASIHLCACCSGWCFWWQMRGGSHRACRDAANNLQSLSTGKPRLTGLKRCIHTVQTLSGSLFIHLHTSNAHHTHSAAFSSHLATGLQCWDQFQSKWRDRTNFKDEKTYIWCHTSIKKM